MEAIQTVKTVLVVEIEGLRRDLALAQKDSHELGVTLTGVKKELDALAKPTGVGKSIAQDLDAAKKAAEGLESQLMRTDAARRMSPISVVSGSTNTNPNAFLKDTERARALGITSTPHFETRMAAPWMLAELERMRSVAPERRYVPRGEFDLDRGRAEQVRAERARRVEAMRADAERVRALEESSFSVDRLRQSVSRAREGLFTFLGIGGLVVAGVKALADHFDLAGRAAERYGKVVGDLATFNQHMIEMEDARRDRRGAGEWGPAPQRLAESSKAILDIGGYSGGLFGKDGTWAAEREKETATETLLFELKRQFQDRDPKNRAYDPGRSYTGGQLQYATEIQNTQLVLDGIRATLRGLEKDYSTAVANRDAAIAASFAEWNKVFWEFGQNARLAQQELAQIPMGLGLLVMDLRSPGELAAEKQRRMVESLTWNMADPKDIAKRLADVKIDARGARIQLTTRLETNDPSRFADVALKSAFLGVSARPLSAVMGLGSPPLANGRSR